MSLLSSAASAFVKVSTLAEIKQSVKSEKLNGHYPPIFGTVCRELGFSVSQTQQGFMFVSVRGLISSAIRLNIVGPLEAQQLQFELISKVQDLLLQNQCKQLSDIAQTSPLLDIIQGTHDRLYSRLFNS